MIRYIIFCFLAFSLILPPAHGAEFACGAPGTRQTPATYVSPQGEVLKACFDQGDDSVSLLLPDGSFVRLPLVRSASGARYSNNGETFWEHQGTGRYFKGERLLFNGTVKAGGYGKGVNATTILKTTTTSSGQKIAYPVTNQGEITVMHVEIAPGAETGWHRHPLPVYAYVLAGNLSVDLEGGKSLSFKAGEAIIEAVDTYHNGRNTGMDPVYLVVFYLGEEGKPNVIKR